MMAKIRLEQQSFVFLLSSSFQSVPIADLKMFTNRLIKNFDIYFVSELFITNCSEKYEICLLWHLFHQFERVFFSEMAAWIFSMWKCVLVGVGVCLCLFLLVWNSSCFSITTVVVFVFWPEADYPTHWGKLDLFSCVMTTNSEKDEVFLFLTNMTQIRLVFF